MSYNSKYTGQQVEALLDIVSQGGGTGGEGGEVQKTTEAEILAMGFTKNQGTITEVKMNGVSKGTSGVVDLGTIITEHQDISGKQDVITDLSAIREGANKGATALQSIPSEYVTETKLNNKGYATTSAMNNALSGKVDKVSGKQLSTEDFTTVMKEKLNGLSNYDDSEIEASIAKLRGDFDALVSGDTTTAIKTFNEVVAFLDGIQDTQSLSGIIASIEQQIAAKMDKVTLANVATSGSYNDLKDKPTIPSVVTESTVSGWGFTKNQGTYSKPSGGIPKTDLASAVQTSLGKADTALQSYTEQYKGTVTGVKMNGTTKNPSSGVVDLGTVITAHQDLSGKQDKLVSGTNIKTINGTSILGSGNIEITGGGSDNIYIYDMFAKAGDDDHFTITVEEEAAIMAATIVVEPTFGLIADMKLLYEGSGTIVFPSIGTNMVLVANFSNYVCYPEIREDVIPTATSQLENDSNFVSSDNLKTINGQSLLGSGDIVIEGGSSSSGSSSGSGKEIVEIGDSYTEIEPNKIYVVTEELHTFEIIDIFITTDSPVDEYTIHFKMANPTTGGWMPWFIVPDIIWANGVNPPELEKGVSYELSVIKTTINGSDVFKGVITPFKSVEE